MARKRKFDGCGCIVVLALLGLAHQTLDGVHPAIIGIFAILIVWHFYRGGGCIVGLVLLVLAHQILDKVHPAIIGIFAILIVWHFYRAERKKRLLGDQLSDLDNLSGEEFEEWITFRLKSDGIQAKNIQHRGDF